MPARLEKIRAALNELERELARRAEQLSIVAATRSV